MKQSLQLKLSQQLTLTPQLKQSLRLLQLPSLELEHEIQQTLDSNPLLERVEREISEPLLTDNKQVEEQKLTVDAPSNDTVSEFEQTDSLQQEQEVDLPIPKKSSLNSLVKKRLCLNTLIGRFK